MFPWFNLKKKSLKSVEFLSIVLLFFVTGCSTNPATGRKEFTPLLPASQEKEVGAQEHANVVKEFGGVYNNQKLTSYVNKVMRKVATASELPADQFQVYILNASEINAFALPGGYLYVTRGLVALANTEAELAGVIGHEIAHVTARHAAGRTNAQAIGAIGSMLATIVTGSQQLGQIAQLGAQGAVASYSRSNESEADMLGVRYIAKAGYNPYGQSDFLRSLRLHTEYESNGNKSQEGLPSFFSTHPDTAGRVEKARQYAQEANVKQAYVGRQEHLTAITGMLWGDDPEQGIIQGNKFTHPDMLFSFQVPPSYKIINGTADISAQDSQGAIIKFDADTKGSGQTPEQYLKYEYAQGKEISSLERLSASGMEGATALTAVNTQNGTYYARIFVLKAGSREYYRFLMGAPKEIFQQKQADFYNTARSLKKLTPNDVKNIRPYQIAVKRINSIDSIQSLSGYIPDFQNKEVIFRSLNGFAPNESLPNSGEVKIINR